MTSTFENSARSTLRPSRSPVPPMMRQLLGTTLIVFALAMPTVAPTMAGAAETSVVIGSRSVPETLDPAQASNASNDLYVAAFYDRLVGFTPEGELKPWLVTEWTYSDDATSLTLKLRDDVTFHSGKKMTATDVAYSLDRLMAIGSGTGGLIKDYVSSEVISDTELKVTLSGPNIQFIRALGAVYVVDSGLVKEHEGSDNAQQWLSGNEAGSGPYSLSTYNPNQQIEIEKTASHWTNIDGRPDEITIRIITDPSAMRDELRAGGIDLGMGIPPIDLASFAEDPAFTVQSMPATIVTLGMMNMQGPVTSDPKVREAIQLSYSQAGHVKAALGGYGKPATSLVPEQMACRSEEAPYEVDVERAKALIDEAGATGKTLKIVYQPYLAEQRVGGTLLEAALRNIGLNVDVQPITYPQYLDAIKTPETTPDVSVYWELARYPSTGPMLDATWASDRLGISNYGQYANPEVDKLLKDAREATDSDAACDMLKTAQELILADRPAILMAFPQINHVYDSKIATLPYSPVSAVFDLSQLTLAD